MEFKDFSHTPHKIQGLITFQDCANPVYTNLSVFTGFKVAPQMNNWNKRMGCNQNKAEWEWENEKWEPCYLTVSGQGTL